MVAVLLSEKFFAFTVVVAAELSPADVTLEDGETVAGPEANHETVRPCSLRCPASYTTAVAVVVELGLIGLAASVSSTRATWPLDTVIELGCEGTPSLVAVIVAFPVMPPVICTLEPLVAESLKILSSLVCQVIARPVTTDPFASLVVATSVVDAF
jgi:hypothetical protein